MHEITNENAFCDEPVTAAIYTHDYDYEKYVTILSTCKFWEIDTYLPVKRYILKMNIKWEYHNKNVKENHKFKRRIYQFENVIERSASKEQVQRHVLKLHECCCFYFIICSPHNN